MMENEVTVARGKRKEESFELVEISAVVFPVWWHELLEFCGLSSYEVLRGVDWNEGLSNDFPRATIFRDDLAGILWGMRNLRLFGVRESFVKFSWTR